VQIGKFFKKNLLSTWATLIIGYWYIFRKIVWYAAKIKNGRYLSTEKLQSKPVKASSKT